MNTTTDEGSKVHATKPASAAAEAQLAKANETRDAILAAQVEREKWMPTPTQAENDAAALGKPVEKKPDGSPVEKKPEDERTRQMEPKPGGGGYSTRHHTAG